MCDKCGHDHNLDERCKASFCIICGLGGDLTSMSCEESQKIQKQIEKEMRKAKREMRNGHG